MIDKAALRKALKQARAAIEPQHKAAWDAAIGAAVLAWWRSLGAGAPASIGVYWPLDGEPDLSAACAELAAGSVPLKPDLEKAWLDFKGWRVNYDTTLLALAALTLAPYAMWSSDRSLRPTVLRKSRKP